MHPERYPLHLRLNHSHDPVPTRQKCGIYLSDATTHAQFKVPANKVPPSRHQSCTSNLTIRQPIILGLQSLESSFSVHGQIRLPIGSNSVSEEPWLPLFLLLLPLGRLVTLPFFDLLLELGRFRVLFALYRTCNASPETLGFVWKLLIDRWNDLCGREKGFEVQ